MTTTFGDTRPRSWISMLLIGALLILLPLLAYLQYRWIGQVSAAERARLQESLDIATRRFVEGLRNEFTRIAVGFRPSGLDSWADLQDRLSHSYDQWAATAPYPELIAHIFVTDFSQEGNPRLLEFDPRSGNLGPAEWPEGSEELRDRGFPRPPRPGDGDRPNGETLRLVIPIPPDESGRDLRFPFDVSPQPVMDWAIVELDRARVTEELRPDLVDRHFDSTNYTIGIVKTTDRPTWVYRSDEEFSTGHLESTDVAFELFTPPPGERRGRRGFGPSSRRRGRGMDQNPEDLSSAVLGTPRAPWADAGPSAHGARGVVATRSETPVRLARERRGRASQPKPGHQFWHSPAARHRRRDDHRVGRTSACGCRWNSRREFRMNCARL